LLIGVARYVRESGDERSCEFAIVIADAWQGRGIGRRLMAKLIAVARGRGLAQHVRRSALDQPRRCWSSAAGSASPRSTCRAMRPLRA
jgi:GNAT superfamily N-acetyltransferase